MNAFILACCVLVIAQLHSDAHVVKMPLEAVQVLFSAVRIAGATIKGKASTHERHPLVRWAASHRSHMKFMLKLALALFAEYVRRYNKKQPRCRKNPGCTCSKMSRVQFYTLEKRTI